MVWFTTVQISEGLLVNNQPYVDHSDQLVKYIVIYGTTINAQVDRWPAFKPLRRVT